MEENIVSIIHITKMTKTISLELYRKLRACEMDGLSIGKKKKWHKMGNGSLFELLNFYKD